MSNFKKLIVGFAILVALTTIGSARTITVGHYPGADYWNIQDALDSSNNGDIIEVWYGNYNENIIIRKSITLKSRDGSSVTTISGNGKGNVIDVTTNHITIDGFTIMNGETGIKIESSDNIEVINNVITNVNSYGIYISFANGVISNNSISSVNGNPSYGIYLKSVNGTISDNTISSVSSSDYSSAYGIYLKSVNGIISDNTISGVSGGYEDTVYGIYLNSVNGTISGNTISDVSGGYKDTVYGIYLNSVNGTISGNTISNVNVEGSYYGYHSVYGIYLNSVNGTISDNTISSVTGGDDIYSYGIYLISSNSNTITSNTISSVTGGISGYGIYLTSGSTKNLIYHNNIKDCKTKGGYDSAGSNGWDGGPTIGGNYWSDYTGIDNDGDGIGDTPYELDGGSDAKDFYPFMNENSWPTNPPPTPTPTPSISVSTDKKTYTTGDTMSVTIDIDNPTSDSISFEQYAVIPQKGYTKLIKEMTISPKKTTTLTSSFDVGVWSSKPFGALWYVQLLNKNTGEILAQDNTMWIYNPSNNKQALEEKIEFPN